MRLRRSLRRGLLVPVWIVALAGGPARAQAPTPPDPARSAAPAADAGTDDAGTSAPTTGDTDAGASPTAAPVLPDHAGAPADALCVEDVGSGSTRPTLKDSLPAKGIAGHAIRLEVVVEHGKGETVLPNGLRFQLGGDQIEALERAGFALPHPDGGAGAQLVREEQGEKAKTTVTIPLVLLPSRAGRQELTLPSLPIAVARASGESMRLCTRPHTVSVEEPIANLSEPQPQPNPPPRRQLEEWTLLKHVVYAGLVALVVGALLAWLILRFLRRPRPAPPPPPPRPPWEVALEELHDIRYAGLVEAGRFDEHYDRVSHTVRKYLGGRFGFDGLESTTREILGILRRVDPPIPVLGTIQTFLREADLVKFARLTPSSDECTVALDRGEAIVRETRPRASSEPAPAPEPPPPGTPAGSPPDPTAERGAPP